MSLDVEFVWGILNYAYLEMPEESTNESTKRKFSWIKSYSSLKSRPAVEQGIGVTIDKLHKTALDVKGNDNLGWI